MKRIYFVLFSFCFILNAYSQTAVLWNSPVTVAAGYSNIYPRLTLMNNNEPLVIWGSTITDKIYSAKWTGTSFSTALPVHNAGVIPYIATWTGAELVSSGDTAFVVFSTDLSAAKVYTVRSIDGGLSFNDTVRVDEKTETFPRLPAIAVNPYGNPVVSYMILDSTTSETEYTIAHSPDGGLSYSSSLPSPNPPGAACDCCPPAMVIEGNTEALIFRNNISNLRDMWASFSNDGGGTFPASAEVDQSGWLLSSCPSSGPSGIISGDTLVTTWMSEGTSGDPRIYVGTISASDQQIGFNKQVYPFGLSTQNFPVIAGNGDTLGIVWQGYNGGSQEILFSWSVNGAAGLGVKVDTITKGTSGHQSRPHLVYKNGSFHVVFRDSNGANVKYMKGDVTIASAISKDELTNLSAFSYFSNDNINLTINSKQDLTARYEVINPLGQMIAESNLQVSKGKNEIHIPTSCNSGIYYVRIITTEGIIKSKVLVVK
jgi:hypothetical protein